VGVEPSVVEISFSLRDEEDRAVVLPAEVLRSGTRIFESGPTTDGWEELDLRETSFFVQSSENLQLEIAFVLDFTNSMALARDSAGRTGIDVMLDAFDRAVRTIPGSHRVGAVEFHDRNFDPTVVSTMTTDKNALLTAVRGFADSSFESGSSRVWDSIDTAATLFTRPEDNPNVVRALIFISDGRDTSSIRTRDDARSIARNEDIKLYSVGIGEVFQETDLEDMVVSTGGAYYPVTEIDALNDQLAILVSDLRGQYRVSYTTLRRQGAYRSRLEVELPDARGELETVALDVSSFFGFDNVGRLAYDPPEVNTQTQTAKVLVRAARVPRNIDQFSFTLDTLKSYAVSLVPAADGGLIADWNLTGPDTRGFYNASASEPLDLGASGLLFQIDIAGVIEERIEIPVVFDNSVYTAGKRFDHPPTVFFGLRLPPSGEIVFRTRRQGNEDLYLYLFGGGGLVRDISGSEANEFLGSWSPEGNRIAFDTDRDGNREIYVMQSDGTNAINISNNTSSDYFPDWSPDGQSIAFSSNRSHLALEELVRDIYVVDSGGGSLVRLTTGPHDDWWPAWSPDGTQIAFTTNRDGEAEIYVMNVDGTGLTNLSNNAAGDFRPAWSPDGSKIAFYSVRDSDREIYVMNADGSDQRNLSNNNADDWYPTWSPSGAHIAFASSRDGNQEIYMMFSDGTIQRNLTNSLADDIAPVWSPN